MLTYQPITFTLTEDLIKLVRNFYVHFEDGAYEGAPCVGMKRPYGNSYIPGDIHEILTGDKDYEELTEEQEEAYLALHRQTAEALQIILNTGEFVPGTYERDYFNHRGWVRINQSV